MNKNKSKQRYKAVKQYQLSPYKTHVRMYQQAQFYTQPNK